MISTIIEGVFKVKEIIESVPIQAMMLAVPTAILAVAGVAAVIAREVDKRVSQGKH